MTSNQPTIVETPYYRIITSPSNEISIELDEGNGNSFHLAPILRKYTSAKLNVKGIKRLTTVDLPLLYDALGLLRSLVYDVEQFNYAADNVTTLSTNEIKYCCYRLTRQASAFGVRVPRPGTGKVDVPGLTELITFIEAHKADELVTAQTLLKNGIIDFQSLAEYYKPGTDLVDRGAATGIFGIRTAMRVRASYFSKGKSLFGSITTFNAALEFIVAVGNRFVVIEHHYPIAEYQGTRSIFEGYESFVVLSENLKQELIKRGEFYARLTSSNAYVEYSAGSFLPVPRTIGNVVRTPARSRGGGRIMIDSNAAWARGIHCARSEGTASEAVKAVLKLIAQRTRSITPQLQDNYTSGSAGQTASNEEESLELLLLSGSLPANLIWLTWPVVTGFSFHTKSWGVVLVAGLKEIEFNELAFERLVMEEKKKHLIEALVLSHRHQNKQKQLTNATNSTSNTHTDIIAGKGEGSIFLLYGPPGVGKTLTAEAIAELLHQPLYVVSMGELGTTPETLEERLLDILDLAVPWNALVLIDEAEMLLEKRSKNDIVRNAMVCIMLRLLEYYTGILFLTTNRVESLDPAFQSRVQCALRYDALSIASRRSIWTDLLKYTKIAHSITTTNIEELASYELNGRQIKNALQLAIALSLNENITLSMKHLHDTVHMTTAFVSGINDHDDNN